MPRTENQKVVTAYLPLELYDKLEQFKLEEGLKSDSKVINTILERWFFGEVPIPAIAKTNHLEERLSEVEKTCSILIDQVAGLIHLSTLSNTVPSTGNSTVASDIPDIVPSTEDSIALSDVPDIVLSTEDSIALSDVPDIVPSTEDSIALSDVPDTVPKLVVCKLYKNNPNDPQTWRYWAGAKAGFVEDLSKAKTYTEKGSSKVINQLLEDELHKPTSRERISCRALEELKMLSEKLPVIC